MLIRNEFELAEPIDKVWAFFGDIPAVASCLPGTTLSESLGDDTYAGDVVLGLGPVKLDFAGKAKIAERNDVSKAMVVDATGAEKKGRGNAALKMNVALAPTASSGTKVAVVLDLNLSGAAAQYGRGLINDVTTVLLGDFSNNVGRRLRGDASTGPAKTASGFAIGVRAARMALLRVIRRFFVPYKPQPSR